METGEFDVVDGGRLSSSKPSGERVSAWKDRRRRRYQGHGHTALE